MPPTTDRLIGKAPDWDIIRSMIRELERTKNFAASVHQWNLTVRLFRQVEQQQFYEKEPNENDRANHRALLHLLIGLGQLFEIQTQNSAGQQWVALRFARANLQAAIADLEDTFFMWYSPAKADEVPPSFLEALDDFKPAAW